MSTVSELDRQFHEAESAAQRAGADLLVGRRARSAASAMSDGPAKEAAVIDSAEGYLLAKQLYDTACAHRDDLKTRRAVSAVGGSGGGGGGDGRTVTLGGHGQGTSMDDLTAAVGSRATQILANTLHYCHSNNLQKTRGSAGGSKRGACDFSAFPVHTCAQAPYPMGGLAGK